MKVNNTLRYWREKVGVTQKELERRIGLGPRQWSDYECGAHEPKVMLAQRFAQVFNEVAKEKGIDIKHLTVDDLYPPGEK